MSVAGRGAPAMWALLALTLLAFGVRVLGLDFQSLWRDETDTLRFATQPLAQLLAMFKNPGQNGPLFFLGLRPWIGLAGNSEFALRFLSTAAGTLAVPVVYQLLRRLTDQAAALAGALLMAVGPYFVWYGQEAKMYALLTVLVPAALLALLEAARRGRAWRWALLYALTSLAFYTHLLTVLLVPVELVWLLFLLPGGSLRRVAIAAGYVALLFLPYLPLLAWQPSFFLSAPETGFAFVPLGSIAQVLAVGFSLGVQPAQSFVALLPAVLLLVAGALLPFTQPAVAGARLSPRRGTLLLLTWLLLPPLLLYAFTLRIPLFTDRYLIWIGPAFAGLAAWGVVWLNRIVRPLGSVVLIAFVVLQVSAVATQSSTPIKSDFRAAAAYVAPQVAPGDVLVYQIPYSRYTFSYYASDSHNPEEPQWHGLDGPYTNDGSAPADVEGWLEDRLGGAQRIWLIGSEIPLWDERGLLEKWLGAGGHIADERYFARVLVRRYEFPGN